MARVTIIRKINASIERVFHAVADIEQFSEAIPHIIKVEFLTEQKTGVGTKFRETRLMKGKEASTELEVIEYVPNERVRIVSDTHGTVWDTRFTLKKVTDVVELRMEMEVRAHKLVPKLLNPLVMSMIKTAIAADMDAVKRFCEHGKATDVGGAA